MAIQPKDTSTGHFWTSMLKSVIRIGAGFALAWELFVIAGFLVIVAEAFGILEEMI